MMAFIQYLTFDGMPLPMPDSYDVELTDVEADSGGETEAGTTQRDVVRLGAVHISVSFSVSPKWLKLLTGFKQQEKISVEYFDTETLEIKRLRCLWMDLKLVLLKIPLIRDCGRCRLPYGSFENRLLNGD